MSIKTKTVLTVTVLALMDVVIPIPMLGIILLYVILQRPSWFEEIFRGIYEEQ